MKSESEAKNVLGRHRPLQRSPDREYPAKNLSKIRYMGEQPQKDAGCGDRAADGRGMARPLEAFSEASISAFKQRG